MLKTLAILFALALVLHPTLAEAKAKGDNIGAPKKEATVCDWETLTSDTGIGARCRTGELDASLEDLAKIKKLNAVKEVKVQGKEEKLTKSEKRAEIKRLKAKIKRLQKLLEEAHHLFDYRLEPNLNGQKTQY